MATVPQIIASLETSAVRADTSSLQLYKVANGPASGPNSAVPTDNGPVPTVAKWLSDNLASIQIAPRSVSTIAALRNLPKAGTPRAITSGYFFAGDTGNAEYWLDATDTASPDNGGSVIVAADGGRWKLAQTGDVTPRQFGARADGSSDDTSAFTALLASGLSIDLRGLTYRVSQTVVFAAPFRSNGATLKFTADVSTALELRPGARQFDHLNIDVSAVACNTGILVDGRWRNQHYNAVTTESIYLKGWNHTKSVNGLALDSRTGTTVSPGVVESFVQYCMIKGVEVENFANGRIAIAGASGITKCYTNANIFFGCKYVGCKRSIVNQASNGAETSNNVDIEYIVQFGAVEGSFPIRAIHMIGNSRFNQATGFIYDWEHINTKGPVVELEAGTLDNVVVSSAFDWEVLNSGLRNLHVSRLTPSQSSPWHPAQGQGFLGQQDNILAHWNPRFGTLTESTGATGTASVTRNSGTSLIDVQRENHRYVQLDFVAGTGVASYSMTFTSTTNAQDHVSVVGMYFEPGNVPDGIQVEINTGAGFVSRAEVADVTGNEVFLRLDPVSGSDVYNGVLAIRITFKAGNTRTVRVRQVYANGSQFKPFLSAGGDRAGGDLRWPAGIGPVLVDTVTGTPYRIQVTNGVIALTANPTLQTTYF